MSILKKVVLMACLVLQLGVVTLAGAGIVTECTLLNPAHYWSVLEKADIPLYIYDDWDGLLAGLQHTTPEEELQAVMLKAFAKEFDQPWLKEQLEQSIEAALAFVKGDAGTIPVTVDFKTKKEHYAELLAMELDALTDEKLAQWGIARGDIGQRAVALMQSEINIPDFLSISEELIGDYNDIAELDESLELPRTIRKWYIITLAGLFLLLTFLTALLGGIRRGITQASRSIVFSGAVLSLAAVPALIFIKNHLIGNLSSDTAFLSDLVRVFFNRTTAAFLIAGIACILMGFVLIYSVKIFARRKHASQQNDLQEVKNVQV